MPAYSDAFSGRSQFSLRLNVVPRAFNQAGNYTDVDFSLAVVETTSSPSYVLDAMPWSATVAGQTWSGASPLDFRASGTQTIYLRTTTTKRVYHDANGYATITVSATMSAGSTFGTATISAKSITLERIPKPPNAPLVSGTSGGNTLGIDNVTTSSLRFRFANNGVNGDYPDQWQYQYDSASNFSSPVTGTSGGVTTLTGLSSGTRYYIRVRGHNVAGWGPWSSTISATTLPSVLISDGSTWRSAAGVFVSNGSSWTTPEIFVSTGSAWVQPLN